MGGRGSIVGISTDLITVNGVERVLAATRYGEAVRAAGGVPVLMHPAEPLVEVYADLCDGFILTGGDDPKTEPFGEATDHRVTPVRSERQAFESALLERINARSPDTPVLGICLGMQMMALHAGGRLDQWMPDSTPSHAEHWNNDHDVVPIGTVLPSPGTVHSKHRQAVADPGSLALAAAARDGTIEAVLDPDRKYYLGVQWHPERTEQPHLGLDLFRRLVDATR